LEFLLGCISARSLEIVLIGRVVVECVCARCAREKLRGLDEHGKIDDRRIGGMATSERRKRANRENARRSTGPRTVEGKEAVRMNALQHGFCASEILIRKGDGKEDATEFEELLNALKADLAPVGVLESMLVERILTAFWRLRRIARFETGAVRANLDDASLKHAKRRLEAYKTAVFYLRNQGDREHLYESSAGVRYLIRILQKVHDELISTGFIAPVLAQECIKFFPGHDLSKKCPEFVSDRSPTATGPGVDGEVLDGQRVDFLEELDYEVLRLKSHLESVESRETLQDERHMAVSGVPSREAIDLICRYETTVERQLFRTLAELERLQRRRKGDQVPVPMGADLAGEE
jgi:hypothetical protein